MAGHEKSHPRLLQIISKLIIVALIMENWGYLLNDSSRQLRRLFDERMRSLGMTGPQARLLLILGRAEGEQQVFYANQLDVEPITLCRMVDRMEEAGLIERRPDPEDRRVRRIYRTEHAREISSRVSDEVGALLMAAAEGLQEADCEVLQQLLSRVSNRLAQMNTRQNAND